MNIPILSGMQTLHAWDRANQNSIRREVCLNDHENYADCKTSETSDVFWTENRYDFVLCLNHWIVDHFPLLSLVLVLVDSQNFWKSIGWLFSIVGVLEFQCMWCVPFWNYFWKFGIYIMHVPKINVFLYHTPWDNRQ